MTYFLYSDEEIKTQNNILKKTGKEFVPGTVVVNGSRKKFTSMSSSSNSRFYDSKIVAKGELKSMIYEKPTQKILGLK
jgi:hypothetical protein